MARHQGRVQCSERALAARVTPRGRADPVRIERDAPMRRSVLVPHATDVLALGADAEKASGLIAPRSVRQVAIATIGHKSPRRALDLCRILEFDFKMTLLVDF